jgi:uncharacterized membrane protein (UPF0127 family)
VKRAGGGLELMRWSGLYTALVLWVSGMHVLAACDGAGPKQGTAESAASAPSSPAASGRPGQVPPSVSREVPSKAMSVAGERCIVARVAPPPPVAAAAVQCPSDPDRAPGLSIGHVRFTDAPSTPSVSVELARTDAARTRGLMYRTHLPEDQGMLFSWGSEEPRSFWMRNTCIPLDMLFIAADGTIVGILEQVPTLNTLPRGVPCPAQHVLELNAGWSRQHGVEPGQRVALET